MQLRNRSTVEGKIVRLLTEFSFAPLVEIIDQTLGTKDGRIGGAPGTQ